MPVETLDAVTSETEVERLLAAARRTIEEVPFFWVVTPAAKGGAHARVVQAQPGHSGEDFWTRWFLTPPNGRKAAEIRQAGRATLAYQHASGEAYVALSGRAELIDDRDEVNRRFRGSANDDPKGLVAASLVAARVVADHLEVHIRGVTAEPWGRGRTSLDRNPDGSWRLHPVHYDSPIVR
jgi:general stress protein 26